jgi:acetyl esterase
MSSAVERTSVRILSAVLRGLYGLPRPVRRLIAGRQVRVDANELALDAQLLLRLNRLSGGDKPKTTVVAAREQLETGCALVGGREISSVSAQEIEIPNEVGTMPGRLYVPWGEPESGPLLVYFHGGGWVVGSLDSHDRFCRQLASKAGVRVLSVDYRLAPEHPFPAAAHDAFAAFRFAVERAADLGGDPAAVAVGGDSAGGNLAASACLQAAASGGPRPCFQLLIYPATDIAGTYPSHDAFATGFGLTREDIDWYKDHYCPDVDRRKDPLCSPLLAGDLSGMPPTHIVTAGFDPLRDEGAALAVALRAAGVPIDYREQSDLVHGFAGMSGVGHRFGEAVGEIVGSLRTALVLAR